MLGGGEDRAQVQLEQGQALKQLQVLLDLRGGGGSVDIGVGGGVRKGRVGV